MNSIKPKQVIKFFRAEHAIANLENERLKVSKSEDFNDPFEILVADCSMPNTYERFIHDCKHNPRTRKFFYDLAKQSDPLLTINKFKRYPDTNHEDTKKFFDTFNNNQIQYAKAGRNAIDKSWRICCFSNLSFDESILMWSHYADCHKGIAIQFEKDLIRLSSDPIEVWFDNVQYPLQRERVLIKSFELLTNPAEAKRMELCWKTKSKEWEYEKEVRWLIPIEECTEDKKLWFKKINPQSIKSICFGLKCAEEDKEEILKLVKENYSWIELFQADYHPRKFALEINPYSY